MKKLETLTIETTTLIDGSEVLSVRGYIPNTVVSEKEPDKSYFVECFEMIIYVPFILLSFIALPKEPMLSLALFFIFVGTWGIGRLTRALHEVLRNREHDNEKPDGPRVRGVAAFFETLLYSVLFTLNQPLFLAGYLVIKSVGSHWGSKERPSEEGNAVAVYRIGILLQLAVSVLAAYCIIYTNFYHSDAAQGLLNFLKQ